MGLLNFQLTVKQLFVKLKDKMFNQVVLVVLYIVQIHSTNFVTIKDHVKTIAQQKVIV